MKTSIFYIVLIAGLWGGGLVAKMAQVIPLDTEITDGLLIIGLATAVIFLYNHMRDERLDRIKSLHETNDRLCKIITKNTEGYDKLCNKVENNTEATKELLKYLDK